MCVWIEIADRKLCVGLQNNPSFGCQRISFSIYIFIFPFCSMHTHTHIHIHPLYHLMLEYECCHTQYTCMTNSHCQYRRQPWTLRIFVVCFLFFGGVCGSMVMVTMENVSFQDTEWFSFRFDAFVKCLFPNFSFRSEEDILIFFLYQINYYQHRLTTFLLVILSFFCRCNLCIIHSIEFYLYLLAAEKKHNYFLCHMVVSLSWMVTKRIVNTPFNLMRANTHAPYE